MVLRPHACLVALALALGGGCSRKDPVPTSASASASVSASASASVSASASASASAPVPDDVDLPALQAKYCAKPTLEACRLAEAFAKAAPLAEPKTPDNIYFGWGYELGHGSDGQKSMVIIRVRVSDTGAKMAKGGVYVPADTKAAKTTSDLVDTLRAGGKASGEAKGFLVFLRGNPGPDPMRLLSKTTGTSTMYSGEKAFKVYIRQDLTAKGTRLLALSYSGGDVLDGPHPCEMRVSEVWELHTEK